MSGDRPLFDPDRIAAPRESPPAVTTLTVSRLNALIQRVLADQLPATIHLVGEISNVSRPASGHLYLTLKDERSEIGAVMWRADAARLKFEPADGLAVVATGQVQVYEPRGRYQFYIRRMEPQGVGALELAFRQLRERLEREGLFDKARKKPIPRYPRRLAVVTSPSGAAVRDVLKTLKRRYPCVGVLVYPVQVQGEGAAAQIAEALRRLNAHSEALGGLDVILLARGGGSLEDLWAFNEEIVARAISASAIPIISGVGHEVDVTIADLAADLRAPTPTAAAELAVPVLDEVLTTLVQLSARMGHHVRHRVELGNSRVEALARVEWFRDPLAVLKRREQRTDEAASRLGWAVSRRVANDRGRLHDAEMALAAVQPREVLHRRRERLSEIAHRLGSVVRERLREAERWLERGQRHMSRVSPARRVEVAAERMRPWQRHLERILAHRIRLAEQGVSGLASRLEATSHRRTLARGFTITRTAKGRRLIRRADEVKPGDRTLTETAEGTFESRVLDSEQPELFD